MRTQQRTFYSIDGVQHIVNALVRSGYKQLGLGEKRVPNGTKIKKVIKLRQWHGEWTGYASHTAAVLYK